MYKLLEWQKDVKHLEEHEKVKTLRAEIGIARFTLQELLKLCEDPNKLLVYNPQIVSLVNQIRALVETTQKLEEKGNLLLDKTVLMTIADAMVRIIDELVTDKEIVKVIAERISDVIEGAVSTTNANRAA